MAQIVSVETLLAQRRADLMGKTVKIPVGFLYQGKFHTFERTIVNGEMEVLDITAPLGEMLTSDQGRKELLKKVVLDVEMGREEVPLLYGSIYDQLSDPNFPKVFDAPWVQYGVVVFAEIKEGNEVKFGTLRAEQGPTARIATYGAGFEYTEEMEKFNESFNITILNKAFGEAYNALLNHLHLGPFITATYAAGNQTAAQGDAGDPLTLKVKKTLQKAVADAAKAKRPGSVLLAGSARKVDIEPALKEMTVAGTNYAAIGEIQTVIYYDGWDIQVGKKSYSYPGVADNKAYLIRPKKGFKELIKQDLLVDANDGDLSRLVTAQLVGRAYRGVYAAIAQNVQEITLPTS